MDNQTLACDLAQRKCKPCEGGTAPLSADEVARLLQALPGWGLDAAGEQPAIARDFGFRNFHETMAFVNAVAWVAHREDHHPDLDVGYRHCRVRYQTHAIGGLSENDFICAARVSALVETVR